METPTTRCTTHEVHTAPRHATAEQKPERPTAVTFAPTATVPHSAVHESDAARLATAAHQVVELKHVMLQMHGQHEEHEAEEIEKTMGQSRSIQVTYAQLLGDSWVNGRAVPTVAVLE